MAQGEKPTWFQIFFSMIAAFFGVQTKKTYERDFSYGKAGPYIIMGIVLTILLVLGLMLAVKLAMNMGY